ncbi:MAG: hypothetical protein ACOVMI_09975 [Chitinophagaceae bacterium]
MKNLLILLTLMFAIESTAQSTLNQLPTYQGATRTKKKATPKRTYTRLGSKSFVPVQRPPVRNVVYQYLDTTFPNSDNKFPITGNAGIGTNSPQNALEIMRLAQDGRYKNFLLQLTNVYTPRGLNEPTIMFSNGDIDFKNSSYWTLGGKVAGNEIDKDPVAFKVGFKAPGSIDEQEFFAIDAYMGRVRIGNVTSSHDGYKLFVEEGILTEKVKVAIKNSEDWFDHVFEKNYALMPLHELSKYIEQNKHLPDVPTTSEVMQQGIDLGKMNGILLKKVEELTLYMIDIKKELDQTKKELEQLKEKK